MTLTPTQRVVNALTDAGCGPRRSGKEWSARCPAHEDRNPSLSLTEGDDGRALVNCHAGCKVFDVLEALGLELGDLYDRRNGHSDEEWTPRGPAVAVYDYVDEHGALLFQVCRTADKQFPQRRPDPTSKTGWRWKLDGIRKVPYRLPQIIQAVADGVSVWICEGEKDVHSLERAGAVATTNPGGADKNGRGKWQPEWNDYFGDAIVCVVADRDEPGRAHARHVARQLLPVAKSVELVEPAEGKDVTDHLAAGLGLDELVVLDIDEEDPPPPAPWRSARSVDPEKIEWVWYPRIPRGKLTLIAGDPGVGKGYVCAAIVAAATSLAPVPDGGQLPTGTVLWASFEDSAADTLRPRLEKQGADLDRVLFLDQWRDLEGRLRPMRPSDVPVLDELLDRVPDAHVLVVDPVGSFIGGGVDAYRDNEVRGVLQPLVDLAEHRRVAVLVVAHLNKAELLKAIYRVAGSIGFVGIARSVLAVGKDEESGRRGVAHGKTNLGPEADTIEYRIVPGARWDDVATLEWVGVANDLSKESLLGAVPKKPGRDPEEREACKVAIATLLADGPKPADYCLGFLKADLLVSDSTIQRAKKELGVICEQLKGPTDRPGSPGWSWRLP